MTRIRTAVLEDLIRHARADAPRECCGLLLGSNDLIDECVPARNVRAGETSYLIDPADHFAALRRSRGEGRAVIGAYHSHPKSAAVPSATDLAEAHDTALLYVIVSIAEPEAPDVAGYRLEEGNFVSSPLVPVP